MKPVALDIQRSGSLGGTEVAMTFDENSIAHIMSVLTDLYSDSELAIIREYSTNAYDSHVEANVNRPIEVTLPTNLTPYLVIQDYGVGMSTDDIINTYSKYGASTKRNTDTQSGTLGLGCKSALAYTAQFTFAAVKDGIKTVVTVSRNQDGTGVMELVSKEITDEPNGVKVSIPVKNARSIHQKAHDFFSYWKPGTVLLNGEEPSIIEGIDITDNMVLLSGIDTDMVVMGNVAYRVSEEHAIAKPQHYAWKRAGVVVWLPIGSVAFTPNREDLRYTSVTVNALDAVRKEFVSNLNAKLAAEIDSSPTAAEAIAKYIDINDEYGSIANVSIKKEWRGKPFSEAYSNVSCTKFRPDASRYQISHESSIQLKDVVDGIFITGMPDIILTSFYKQKIRKLIEGVKTYNQSVYIVDEKSPLDLQWFGKAHVYTWDQVKAVKLSDGSGSRSYGKQYYKVLSGTWWEETDEIDPDRPIYYGTMADGPDERWLSRTFGPNDQVVMLGRNRWDKFVRDYPHAKKVSEGYQIKRQEYLDSVPQDVVDSLLLDNRGLLQRLDETQIDDPQLKHEVELSKKDCALWVGKFNMFNQRRYVKGAISKYSMINPYSGVHSHIYIYINAVYNSSKEEK